MPTAQLDIVDLAARIAAKAVKELQATGYKHDSPGSPATIGYMHGEGGVLSYPGIDPDVYQTIGGTMPGLINELPTLASVYDNPMFQVLTGIRGDTGEEKSGVCDIAPVGGTAKGAKFTFPFGRYERATREIELNRLGRLNDRAEPMDLRLVGGPTLRTPFIDGSGPTTDALNNEIAMVQLERAVSFARLLTHQLWQGNPANNTVGGGYREFGGLELMLSNSLGWADAETGTRILATAPDLKDFNYARVDSNGDALINNLSYMFRWVRDRASRTGVEPVRWVFAMRETLFWEITRIWPCSYLTNMCATPGTSTFNIDSGDVATMRDDMRNGRYLLLDGIRVPVILDDGITETTNTDDGNVTSGCFASDIYLLPMSVMGGRATLYLEYFDFRNPSLARMTGSPMALFVVSANGAFIDTITQTRWCLQLQAKIEPRLVLRTPWLAGRLQHVQYCPLQVPPSPFPEDPYHRNGGQTSRPGPSLYNPW